MNTAMSSLIERFCPMRKPAAEIVEAVYHAAQTFSDHAPQDDDMTVLVLKAESMSRP
jgi:serine phosphatase RsbU (regulator of sigma subunit)